MIKKTSEGYQVVSHSGKPLSDNDLSYMQAKDRLKEVDFFKRVNSAMNDDETKKRKVSKPKPSVSPSPNTSNKSMKELLELQKQQEERKKYPHGKPDKSLEEKLNKKTNEKEPNPTSMNNTNKTNNTKAPAQEKPFEQFDRIKRGFDKNYQKSIDKVLYGK